MAKVDPDQPDTRLVRELVAGFEASARRLRERVVSPPGTTDSARRWNQARAATVLSQVEREIEALQRLATQWTGPALEQAMRRGIAVADQQAREAGVRPGGGLRGAFDVVDRRTAEVFARDTVGDLFKAARSMRGQAEGALRRMAATGVSNAEVNRILAGGVIEGQPVGAIRELREALRKVHGNKVTIIDKNGDPREFKVGHYAEMVARTKTRQATVAARHARLRDNGIDLVVIIGRNSVNFCTDFLGNVYSLSGSHPEYPPLSSTPGGGPPYHPNCSKGTAPYIEALQD